MLDRASGSTIDWTRVERWTTQCVTDENGALCTALRKGFDGEPTIVRNPQPSDVASDKARFLLEYWTGLRRGAALPLVTDINPIRMRPALGYVMLVDVVDGGRDFRYRLYGSGLASVSGFDMTSRLLSTHEASANVAEFALAVYRRPAGAQYVPNGSV